MATATAKTKVEGVVLTLSVDEAKTLVEYLNVMDDGALTFRLRHISTYDVSNAIKGALAA